VRNARPGKKHDGEFERLAKEGEQKELAEIVAAIEYHERTGQSQPGYVTSV
jgi:hypothetical protein